MSYNQPANWHGHLKEMLARAGQMDECETETPAMPAAVRQFAPRKDHVGALPDIEIPSFLKRGPRAEGDVIPSSRGSLASRQGA